jgi:hypothetical protein
MSSALTGNKIKDSYQALLKIGTNGSLDPITPISISDGLGNDTPILLSRTEFKTQVVSTAKFYGFWADVSSNSHVALGDYAGQYNGTQLYVNDSARLIQTYGGANKGFKLNFANNLYQFGDYNNAVNGVGLDIDVSNQNILTKGNSGFLKGIALEFSINNYRFGDYDYVNNGTYIGVDDSNQFITTYNNGSARGLELNFAGNFRFGDFAGVYNAASALDITAIDATARLYAGDASLTLYPFNNIYLGNKNSGFNIDFTNSSILYNYFIGSDWQILNSDITRYPFEYNTVLNCYNNYLNTFEKAMRYNFFANIQDPSFALQWNPNIQDKQAITNCFMFGLTDLNGSNTFRIFTPEINQTNTNVVILNGSGLSYAEGVTNIFSVNASLVNIGNGISGITILGGDYYRDGFGYVTAQHIIEGKNIYGVNVKGRYARPMNPYSDVTAEYFPAENTIQGQVQVEQFQLYRYYNDGSGAGKLNKSNGNPEIVVRNSSSYRVNLKLVSTTGDGDFTTSGNSSYDINWLVCVDASGNVTATSPCEGCKFDDAGATGYDLGTSQNKIEFAVTPDVINGNQCWVKGLVTLNLVTTN